MYVYVCVCMYVCMLWSLSPDIWHEKAGYEGNEISVADSLLDFCLQE